MMQLQVIVIVIYAMNIQLITQLDAIEATK